MNLLDLPVEITRLIVRHNFESWSIRFSKFEVVEYTSWQFRAEGLPSCHLQLTCRTLRDLAEEAERSSYTGKMYIEEDTATLSPIYEALLGTARINPKLEWVHQNTTTLRLSNPGRSPALWRCIGSLSGLNMPQLQRLELDCRYLYHFAVHNVAKYEEFISGKDGKLEKLMDYRKSFFLGCEDFVKRIVEQGLQVAVIRDMGVREGTDRCRAVAVAVDYVADDAGNLILDWASVQSKAAVIDGWPEKIRETLEALEI